MEYTKLGNTGMDVSRICLGCMGFGDAENWVHKWVLNEENSRPIIKHALELGINFFDTANVYSIGVSEEILGRALKDFANRDEVVIATKVHGRMREGSNGAGLSRKAILSEIDHSLRRLGTDHIDLYQIHSWDGSVQIEETLRTLDDLVRAGKVRYLGASNFDAWQLCRANDVAEMRGWEAFVSVQPEYNMLAREIEKELLPYCEWSGVGLLPYFPLAGGFLTGKYTRGEAPPAGTRGQRSQYVQQFLKPENFDVLDRLRPLAEAQGRPLADLAIAWLLAQPRVSSVIAGATKPEQIRINAAASTWKLTAEEMAAIQTVLEGKALG